MKKVKILIFIIALVLLGNINVKADGGTNIGGGGQTDSYCIDGLPQCYSTVISGLGKINGVRITIVDSSGKRVTKSVDFINSSLATGTSTNLSAGSLQYNGRYGALKTLSGKNDKNEMISNGVVSGGYNGNNPTVYYWDKIPSFVDKGENTLLKNEVESLIQSGSPDLNTILSILGYNDLGNETAMKNQYMLMETLVCVRLFDNYGNNLGIYYGTATEVYSMFKADGKLILNGMWKSEYPLSIYTGTRNEEGQTYNYTAGLNSIEGSGITNWKDYMLSSYGLAAGHVWMGDFTNCTKSGTCKETEQTDTGDITCDTSPTTSFTKDCDNSTTGSVSDTKDWACIFSTASSAQNTFNGQFYHPNGATVSNEYCTVACREDINYYFSSSGLVVLAGNRFAIGSSSNYGNVQTLSPVEFSGKSTCRTAYQSGTTNATINVTKFQTDYSDANKKVADYWNSLQYWNAKMQAFNNARQTGSKTSDEDESTCTSWVQVTDCSYCGSDCKTCTYSKTCSKVVGGKTTYYSCSTSGANCGACGENCHTCNDKRSRTNCKSWAHGDDKYTMYYWSGSYSYYGGSVSISYQTSDESENNGNHSENKYNVKNDIQNNINYYQSLYNQAVARRNQVLQEIRECNNFQRPYSEFNPEVSFAYGETNYSSNYQLSATSTTTSTTIYYNSSNVTTGSHAWSTSGYSATNSFLNTSSQTDNYGSTTSAQFYSCGNALQACSSISVTYPTNAYAVQTTTKTFDYSLGENIYRYVNKQGVSFNTESDAELSGVAYSDIGYSNLPVSYSTPEGNYSYYYEFYYTSGGNANLFGTSQKYLVYNPSNLFTPGSTETYSGLTLASTMAYHCTYYVDNEIIPHSCDGGDCSNDCTKTNSCTCLDGDCKNGNNNGDSSNKDINVVYRTIDLNNPFPGENGDGRSSGTNWSGYATVNGTYSSFIQAYITDNRGVDTTDVYEETPMYQFVLTPANIRAIRKYNNTQSDNYNDYTLDCTNGEYCKSTFLSTGLANGYFKFTADNSNGGSCLDADKTNWDSCRYTHLGG